MVEMAHKWELAGLGKAPYTFVGMTESKFQAAPGEPVRPGSSCDYCPASIMNCYWFESADGKRFKVGCDCFYSANSDKALRRKVDAATAAHERKLADARKLRAAERNLETYAELLAELDAWAPERTFRGSFSESVAKQIRKGKKPSPRQIACIERLRTEAA